jgi:methyl-accepting chemotaxis protein
MMDSGCVILVNNKGNILVNSGKNSYALVTVAGLDFWKSVTRISESNSNRVYAFDEKIDGQGVHIVASKDAATGWTLVGFVPTREQIQPAISNIIKNAVLVWVLAVIAGIAVALAITMFVRGEMHDLNTTMRKIARGDITARVKVTDNSEFGVMRQNYNEMADGIFTLIRNVEEKSAIIMDEAGKIEKISESTAQTLKCVTDTIQSMTEEPQEQTRGYAADTGEAVSIGAAVNMDAAVNGMDELTELLDDSKGYVREVSDSTEKTQEFSHYGIGVVEEIIHKGKWSKDTAQMAKQAVDEMMLSVKKIKTTSAAVAHITEQTRLLARKASVEAAMAGNAGRGFSVAAEEIRKLAEKSQKLTNEIEMILEEINTQSITMAKTADFSIAITDDTNKIADEALKLFDEIKSSIGTMTEGIECIAELGVHIDRSRENMMKSIIAVNGQSDGAMSLDENYLHKAEL